MYFLYSGTKKNVVFVGQLHVMAKSLLHKKSLTKMILCAVITVYALVANKV